jgi:hypothetical protein
MSARDTLNDCAVIAPPFAPARPERNDRGKLTVTVSSVQPAL